MAAVADDPFASASDVITIIFKQSTFNKKNDWSAGQN
jgi:hypothetical protein